jgi:hypothetical protein
MGTRKEDTHFFEEVFKSRNLILPSIKHLAPGPSSHYLVGMCPNLETLKNGGGFMWYHGYMPDGRDWGLMLFKLRYRHLNRSGLLWWVDSGWTPSPASGMYFSSQPKQMTRWI